MPGKPCYTISPQEISINDITIPRNQLAELAKTLRYPELAKKLDIGVTTAVKILKAAKIPKWLVRHDVHRLKGGS